jgi:hypothetical protein
VGSLGNVDLSQAFDDDTGYRCNRSICYLASDGVPMTNLLDQAISCDDGDRAAMIIQSALGIESDDVATYCFPKTWPADREQRAAMVGGWLRAKARYPA